MGCPLWAEGGGGVKPEGVGVGVPAADRRGQWCRP